MYIFRNGVYENQPFIADSQCLMFVSPKHRSHPKATDQKTINGNPCAFLPRSITINCREDFLFYFLRFVHPNFCSHRFRVYLNCRNQNKIFRTSLSKRCVILFLIGGRTVCGQDEDYDNEYDDHDDQQ